MIEPIYHNPGITLTLTEIDERLTALTESLRLYHTAGEPGISPIDALEVIDELLDLRHQLTHNTPPHHKQEG